MNRLELTSIIRKSTSIWRNPIRPVLKENGTVRICTNLIALNELVIKDDYPTPIMNDLIERVQGANYFTVIDLKDGYFQIEIDPKDSHKTAFTFENNIYEWVRMPMGFKNAPSIFQRVMDKILSDLISKGVEVYLDDIVIHAECRDDHDTLVREVFRRLERNKLFINMEKIQFAKRQIKLLGMEVNGEKQCMIKDKKSGILEYPRPTTKKALQRFLGKMNFYSGFIKGLSTIAVPLYEKVGAKAKFEWNEQMESAFKKLKEELSKETELYLPDYNKKFILETDASNTGLGACLYQYNTKNELVPIRWASKKLSPTEQRYGITEKVLFAVVWGIKNFDYQLRGRDFHLITDHKALESIKKKGDFGNSRMSRWIEKIQEYNFTIEYKKGEEVISADALSRIYEDDVNNKEISVVKNTTSLKWKEKTFIENEIEYYRMDNGDIKIVPEIEERKRLILKTHEELIHRGLEPTYYELFKTYFWPGMKKSIEHIITKCENCNQNNRKNLGGTEFVETTKLLEKTAIDILSLGDEDLKVLVWIDYFTRLIKIKVLKNRKTEEIIKSVESMFKETGYPEEINTDNAKEFISLEFEKYCVEKNINHHLTSVENHRANGRVERIIRTIRDGVVKLKNTENIEEALKNIENAYNKTYHLAIHMSPEEAWQDKTGKAKLQNTQEGKYAKQFKKLKREIFEIGQHVRIAQRENLNTKGNSKGKSNERYQEIGTITGNCGQDSYIVKDSKGKIKKKSHCDLKGIKVI